MIASIKIPTYDDRKWILEQCLKGTRAEKCVNELINMGFLDSPASTKYHGNSSGGLFTHSYQVFRALKSYTDTGYCKEWMLKDSPAIISIFHDLCKVDCYIGNDSDGYRYNSETLLTGHGWKSVILTQKLGIELTEEDIACIVYHMGAFTEKEEWNSYTNAIHKYPNVLWTHTADMVASHIDFV